MVMERGSRDGEWLVEAGGGRGVNCSQEIDSEPSSQADQ